MMVKATATLIHELAIKIYSYIGYIGPVYEYIQVSYRIQTVNFIEFGMHEIKLNTRKYIVFYLF